MNQITPEIIDQLWQAIENLDYLVILEPTWTFLYSNYFSDSDTNLRSTYATGVRGETSLLYIDNTFLMLVLCAEGVEIC